MRNLLILGLILGFALPSYGQLVSVDTLVISGDTLEVEKVKYLNDTLLSIRKKTEKDYFSVKVEGGEVTSFFSSTEKEKVYLSYHSYEGGYESFFIIDSNTGWYSREATSNEKKEIKKRIREVKKEYLKKYI